jgi:3-isopropylmalate/(R)-2-methylmalate dehydratase small subunit
MNFHGRAHVFGDDIDTDVILSARRMTSSDPEVLARYCMETIDPGFASRVKHGDLMVCGENFGCGSSREHAPLAIRSLGIGCIIAKSFARIFYRNAFNIGLAVVICPEAASAVEDGDLVKVDVTTGLVTVGDQSFRAEPIPQFLQEILRHGGLLSHMKQVREQEGRPG